MSNSCNKKTQDTDKYAKLIVEDQLTVNTQLFEFTKKYVNKNPRFDTFVIMLSKMYHDKEADSLFAGLHHILRGANDYYIIGPAFEYLFFKDDLPFCYFICSNKKVFIKTGFEKLLNASTPNVSNQYLEKQIDTSLSNDSINFGVVPPGLAPFLFHSTLFIIDKRENDIIVISTRPDTLFLPPPPIIIEKGISGESIH